MERNEANNCSFVLVLKVAIEDPASGTGSDSVSMTPNGVNLINQSAVYEVAITMLHLSHGRSLFFLLAHYYSPEVDEMLPQAGNIEHKNGEALTLGKERYSLIRVRISVRNPFPGNRG